MGCCGRKCHNGLFLGCSWNHFWTKMEHISRSSHQDYLQNHCKYIQSKNHYRCWNIICHIMLFQRYILELFCQLANVNLLETPWTYIIPVLAAVRYMRRPTNLLNRVRSTLDPTSSLLSFVPIAIGVNVGLQFIILNLFNTSMTYLA